MVQSVKLRAVLTLTEFTIKPICDVVICGLMGFEIDTKPATQFYKLTTP